MRAARNLTRKCLAVILMASFGTSALAQPLPNPAQQQLATAGAGFSFRLLKELGHEKSGANVFVSPFSISTVLAMLRNGARGKTESELGEVLGLRGMPLSRMNEAYAGLAKSISATESNVFLSTANALWYRNGAQLLPDFSTVNEKYYHATLGGLDFSDPRSAQEMNRWAAENTHGKIQTMIQPPIPADTAVVIANAIYFKGTWANRFDPKQTRARAFHTANTEKQLPMMQQARKFDYQEGPGFQAVQLPYTGNRLQMQIFLPAAESNLTQLLDRLDESFWDQTVLPSFVPREGTLVLPRFRLEFGADLKPSLNAMGLQSAWSPNADFSGMSSSRLFLSQVKHQSFVEVNEEGTEAAAVTTGVMALTSVRTQPPPFQMVVDRPFLFAISDRATHALLFIGLVYDPAPAN